MKSISLHNLIVQLQKKNIELGPDPKATVSLYSELGLIPPPKIKAQESTDLPPEISYPQDTIKKIIEIKDLKKKGLRLEEIRDSYALDYVKSAIEEIMESQNEEKLQELVRRGRDEYPGANHVFQASSIIPGQRLLPIDLRYRKDEIDLKYGDIVERHIVDGDIALLNRQPTLHKQSMMGHYIKVIDNDDYLTYRLSVGVTTPYNADFDKRIILEV